MDLKKQLKNYTRTESPFYSETVTSSSLINSKSPLVYRLLHQYYPNTSILFQDGQKPLFRTIEMKHQVLEILQNKCDIIIVNDGSKSERISGGDWIIVDSSGTTSISGSTPDFDTITLMNSHRSETYAVLSALLFLREYCRYFMLPLSSQVKYFCDNLEVVNKMKQPIKDEQYYDEYIKTADHDAVHLLKKYLPRHFTINNVRSNQDKRKKRYNVTTAERLNIAADELVGSTSSQPIKSHINTPFVLYLEGLLVCTDSTGQIR